MDKTFQIEMKAQRKATEQEKKTLQLDIIVETFTDRIRGHDRTNAASKGMTAAKKRWPQDAGWRNHSAVVM